MGTTDPSHATATNASDEGDRFPQRIRRCFMTGKQCIFSSRQSRDGEVPAHGGVAGEPSVFVVMPFRPNLDTFYEWSLKRYLRDGLQIAQPDQQIRRADEFRDIGYVMCEKICRRIQEAEIIVVDLSVENPNVMYEMGLAVGLGKPLLVVCNAGDEGKRIKPEFMESIGLSQADVLVYPSVGYVDPDKNPPRERLKRISLKQCSATMKIVPLVVHTSQEPKSSSLPDGAKERVLRDIDVGFREALRAAVGVAIAEIDEVKDKPEDLREAWRILVDEEKLKALGSLKKDDDVVLVNKDSKPAPFRTVADVVDSAFTCIVDLAGENAQSYFWLGYCHARGINAIPIYRDVLPPASTISKAGDGKPEIGDQHVIAFDIRALWYIKFDYSKIKELANRLRAALEELIAKDIPRQQRNVFWEKLTRHPTVHIYTGAVHHDRLQREVVGDWDQRTVSELVRYLSSAEESVVPELERPIYSPGTIKEKLGGDWTNPGSLSEYEKLVQSELKDKNCVIVASADVNPLTEIVLAHAYGLQRAQFSSPARIRMNQAQKLGVVVALKGWRKDAPMVEQESAPAPVEDDAIPTFFSRTGKTEGVKEDNRGFLVDGRVVERPYQSQDQVADQKFSLLSHLVVMRNPFSQEKRDTLIVLLNGVSGPATFALAEVLTGGKSQNKAVACEKLLADFNRVWGKAEAEAERQGRLFGVEGIVEVTIQPKKQQGDDTPQQKDRKSINPKNSATVDDKFFDKREVLEWHLLMDANDELASGNPRPFYFGPDRGQPVKD